MESPTTATFISELRGRRLGPYQLEELIGRGGMAVVYKALQPALRRHVAIKVLPAYFVHAEGFLARFRQEAEMVAHLEHPNILPIYDYGQEGDVPYIVMPLVSGGTLRQWLGEGPTLDRALRVFSHLLSALDYAHTRQPSIVHRDLKPSNVLMSHGDWPLLTDFGIAKIVEPSMQLTRSGMMVGTPEYMAPEQSEGRGVDHRADLYAMGVILFEILTGHVPFQGSTPIAVILQHVQARVPAPREVNPALSPVWDEVIARSLAKAPADRYPSAAAMSEAIQAAWREAQAESGAARLVGQADPRVLYESAERALSSGEWLRVVSICGQLLEIDPAHPEALQLLITAHQALRRERGEPPTPVAGPAVQPELGPPTARRDAAVGPSAPQEAPSGAGAEQFGTAERLYADAGADIKAERWDAAAEKLAALSAFAPDYRDVATLRRDVAIQQRRETQLAAWYDEALAAETRRDWPDALAAYQQILGEAPSYRDVAARVDAAEQEWALDQGLTSARSTLAAGRADEAIALLETLLGSAPQSAEARTLLAQARSQSVVEPSLAGAAVEAPLETPPALPDEGTQPRWTPTPQPRAAASIPWTPAESPVVRSGSAAPGANAAAQPSSRIEPRSAETRAIRVNEINAPTATPAPLSTGELPEFVAAAPEDQRWKVVLLAVPVALAILAIVGFQRLTAGSANAPITDEPIALATPALPAGQATAVSSPTPVEPTAVPTLTAAELFTDCQAAVDGADWAGAAESCEKARARDAGYPGLAGALATTYVALGKQQLTDGDGVTAALAYFEKAADAQPEDAAAQRQLQQAIAYREGKAALAAENWPAATERFDDLYGAAPDYLEQAGDESAKSNLYLAALKWGEALLRDGQYADAREKCQKALDLQPESQAPKACIAAATAALATPTPVRVQPQAPAAPARPPQQPQPQAPAPPRPQPQAQPQPQPQARPPAAPAPQPQPQPQALPTRPPVQAPAVPPTRPAY